MSQLNFDALSLVFQQIEAVGTVSDLKSVANVCRLWRNAAVSWLFHSITIDFSSGRERQLQSLDSSISRPKSALNLSIRKIQITGTSHDLLHLHLNAIVKALQSLPILSRFSWRFRDNIPWRLFTALEDHRRLSILDLWLYPRPGANPDCFSFLRWSSKTLLLTVDGSGGVSADALVRSTRHVQESAEDSFQLQNPPASHHGSQALTLGSVNREYNLPENATAAAKVECLRLVSCDVRLWEKTKLSNLFEFECLSSLILVGCDKVMSLSWQRYPESLKVFEIIDPLLSYDVKAGIYLSRDMFEQPLSRFRNLEVLNLQNVSYPIGEVLINLVGRGTNLRALKLHDLEISGLDIRYQFRRHQPQGNSDYLECSWIKLLREICPNLQALSIDISSGCFQEGPDDVVLRGSDSRSASLEPLLDEIAKKPTLPVSDTLRSFPSLRFLHLVTPPVKSVCNDRSMGSFAERMQPSKTMALKVTASPLIKDYLDEEEVLEPWDKKEWRYM